MTRLLLTSVFLLLTAVINAQKLNLDDLYRQVDQEIEHFPEYVAQYEQQIAATRTDYQKAKTQQERYRLALALYEQYRAFQNDSALAYLNHAETLARQMNQPAQVGDIISRAAFQCSTAGLYNEALAFLRKVDKTQLDTLGLTHYYMAQMHVYGELGYYTQVSSMREGYYEKQAAYRDSLYNVIDHNSQDYMMQRILELLPQKRYQEATDLSDRWLKDMSPESRDYAIASYYRYLIINNQMNPEQAEYWLCQSALSDIRHAVMDQASLLALAEKLNDEGELTHSYHYIRFTWECNNRFNTRMRNWQIAPILNVIDSNYKEQLARNTQVLTTSVIVVSILAVMLLGLLFFLHRRNKQLDVARQAVSDSNEKLAALNEELKSTNAQLSDKNDEFVLLNSQLSESNRVKEEYIGRFMSLCSQYIDKIDDYRKMVNKKMKDKELDELYRLSKSTALKEKELDELYENFDSVFLHLFPNFVEDFNGLLQPEMRLKPRDDNRLPTEIRIFALIRLGFEDSSKIAEFLHYSVNTIYNYRARIKNGAIGNRESFEQRVKQLGLI
ncbi:MAG: transcriptional regulator [Prevotella sp.]|nr:transcriptional regulator [Prevotella sp.]